MGANVKLSSNNDRNRYMIFMAEQPLPLEVTCEPWKEPRKLTANAYLWAFVYKPLVEVAGHTSDDWHAHFCGEHFGWREHVLPSGNVEYRPVRTTTTNEAGGRDVLKGEPFNEFLMFVESECAKRGVFIEREFAV